MMVVDARKYLKWATVIAAVLVANVAFASHYDDEADKFFQKTCSKKKLEGIKAFVCDLRERLDNIQLVLGPQGPQGPKGDKGDPGEQGPPGDDASSKMLKIFDANGTELGPLVDFDHNGQAVFFYEPLQRFIHIYNDKSFADRIGRIVSGSNLAYPTPDCTGPGYYQELTDVNMVRAVNSVFALGPGRYYVVDRDTPTVSFECGSLFDFNEETHEFRCSYPCFGTLTNTREPREVQLPFDDPVAMPLRFGVN